MNDKVTCQMCGQTMKDLTSHIFRKHGIKAEKYKELYPGAPIRCESLLKQQSERIKGDKNPAYQHGGKFSPFSNNFIHGTDKIEETKRKAIENRTDDKCSTKIEYWLKKTNGDREKAKLLLSERQSTFSLKKCIAKYGIRDGTEIWNERQCKWQKSMNDKPPEEIERIHKARMCDGKGYSKISQELFNSINILINEEVVYYATSDKNKDNNEYFHISKLTGKKFFFDFFYPSKNKIIEFDGDYWHSEKRGNKERDMLRHNILEQEGFIILRVCEKDYKNDKQGTIEKCINFLMS